LKNREKMRSSVYFENLNAFTCTMPVLRVRCQHRDLRVGHR
jgi:hypothetical protein